MFSYVTHRKLASLVVLGALISIPQVALQTALVMNPSLEHRSRPTIFQLAKKGTPLVQIH